MIRKTFLMALFLMPRMASAADIYVSPSGSDSNSGSQTAPVKTIQEAVSMARAGDTIRVAPGNYTGSITVSQSGTASARIRLVSTVKWGAKILGSRLSLVGDYIDVDGFEVNGQNSKTLKTGISTRGSFNRITNNNVHSIATDPAMCDQQGGAGIVTTHYYDGVNIDIIGNVVYKVGSKGCIYIQGIYMATSGNVKNNLVYEIGNWGVHLWHDAHKINIVNNTIVKSGGGITVGGGGFYSLSITDDVYVANNIVYGNDKGISEQGTVGSRNKYVNNLLLANGKYNTPSLKGKSATGTINADPKFVDYAGANYSLQSSSPAINKGASLSAPPTDIRGTARPQGGAFDIGAYEFVSTAPAPTPAPAATPAPTATPVPTATPTPTPSGSVSLVVTGDPSTGTYSVEGKTTVPGDVSVQFYDNGVLRKTEVTIPYCLTTEVSGPARCTAGLLGAGTHNLMARVVSADGKTVLAQTSKTIVEKSVTAPTPAPTATPVPLDRYNLYVSPTGSDSNSGTQTAPLKTIVKASQLAKPGTVVHVAPGTYAGSFTTNADGTAADRIRYISTVKWGAKIVPPATSNSSNGWSNKGDYVDIIGFEIDGTKTQAGTKWRNALVATGSYNLVKGNHIHHVAEKTEDCISSGGSAINSHNYDLGYHNDIIGNTVHHIGPPLCKYFAGIYFSTSGTVKNNLIYEVGNWGIQTWHDAANIEIANNTIVKSGGGIMVGGGGYYHLQGPADYIHVSNNIVFDNAKGIMNQGEVGTHNTYTNNLSFKNVKYTFSLSAGTHTGTVMADPQFIDYAGGNYRLKSASPAIDKGAAKYAPLVDIEGKARPRGAGFDLGAYEY